MTDKTVDLDMVTAAADEEADEVADEASEKLRSLTYEKADDAPPEDVIGTPRSMTARLNDLKVGAKTNGRTFSLTFEVAKENSDWLFAADGSYDVVWQKRAVGQGGIVGRISGTRDADGVRHAQFVVALPESELRKAGWLLNIVGDGGVLEMNPQQLALGLTSRAE